MNEEEEDNYMKERKVKLLHNSPYDVDRWCDLLKEETFETFFFPLTYEEAEALVNYYRCIVLKSKRRKFTEDHEKLVDEVEKKIQKIMDEHPSKDGFFVRLGSRSPKDSVFMEDLKLSCFYKMNRMLENYLREFYVTKKGQIEDDDKLETVMNKEVNYFNKATCYSLSVSNSKEAMEMLLHSERVFSDILLYLDFKDLYEEHPLKMIIRKWSSELPNRNEFRCFVKNNQMNAASQYYNFVYYPKLRRQEEEVKMILKEYFDTKISPILKENGYTDYTIDLGIMNNGKPIVIELNSSDDLENSNKRGTGAALFHWKEDQKVLEEGPYEFRMVRKPPIEDLKTNPAPWAQYIRNARSKVLRELEREEKKNVKDDGVDGCYIL